jgi:hypothetical protein
MELLMKKSKVKRFDMGGYTAGMEAMGRRAAENAANKRDSDYKSKGMAAEKTRRDEQIALDKADALEEFAPEKYIIPGVAARSVLRNAVPAIVRGGADILRNEFMGPQTSEGLPTAQRLRDVRSRVAPGRLVRNKSDMERIAGYRDQYIPGTSNTRNEQYRREAEEMGIPPLEYLKGRTAAEEGSMGLNPNQTSTNAMDQLRWKKGGVVPKGGKVGKVMGEFKSGALKSSSGQKVTNRKQAMAIAMSEAGKSMKTKKYAAGGKTDKRSFSSGDVFSNYDVGDDPFLRSRQGGVWSLDEMKNGLTKKQIKDKTTPALTGDDDMSADLPKKKYSAGGNVKKLKEPNRKVPAMKRSDAGESPAMVKKEMAFMQRKGAPKSMIAHEKKEAKGAKKMAAGGMSCMKRGGGIEKKGYDIAKKFAKGGSIDGCAQRGKTKAAKHRK